MICNLDFSNLLLTSKSIPKRLSKKKGGGGATRSVLNSSSNSPPPPLVFKPRCARRWDGLIIQSNLAILSQSLMIQSLMIKFLMMQIQSLILQSKYYHRPNYSYSYPPGPGQNHQNFIRYICLSTSPVPGLQREQCFCKIVNIVFVL